MPHNVRDETNLHSIKYVFTPELRRVWGKRSETAYSQLIPLTRSVFIDLFNLHFRALRVSHESFFQAWPIAFSFGAVKTYILIKIAIFLQCFCICLHLVDCFYITRCCWFLHVTHPGPLVLHE